MKRKILTLLAIVFVTFIYSQDKYFTKNGEVLFEASVPSFEEIKSENNNVTAILNSSTGELAVLALMKGFRFKVALMEEHFNENYVESDKYPKASFSGKLDGFSIDDISKGDKKYMLKGTLTLHGKEKAIETEALIKKEGKEIKIETEFKVKSEDFDIKVPSVVKKKIASEIEVKVNLMLQKK